MDLTDYDALAELAEIRGRMAVTYAAHDAVLTAWWDADDTGDVGARDVSSQRLDVLENELQRMSDRCDQLEHKPWAHDEEGE